MSSSYLNYGVDSATPWSDYLAIDSLRPAIYHERVVNYLS